MKKPNTVTRVSSILHYHHHYYLDLVKVVKRCSKYNHHSVQSLCFVSQRERGQTCKLSNSGARRRWPKLRETERERERCTEHTRERDKCETKLNDKRGPPVSHLWYWQRATKKQRPYLQLFRPSIDGFIGRNPNWKLSPFLIWWWWLFFVFCAGLFAFLFSPITIQFNSIRFWWLDFREKKQNFHFENGKTLGFLAGTRLSRAKWK